MINFFPLDGEGFKSGAGGRFSLRLRQLNAERVQALGLFAIVLFEQILLGLGGVGANPVAESDSGENGNYGDDSLHELSC